MTGTLYVVSTPIGNLSDISPRAVQVLREVGACYVEDTRRTRKLLAAYHIRVPLRSFHSHNEQARIGEVLDRLRRGEDCALVSDAGMPGVSDPGFRLVRAAHDAKCRVVPVPGPSAVSTAVAASGLPGGRYLFLGFAPRSGGGRREWMRWAVTSPVTVVAFESPRRVAGLLADLEGAGCGERICVLCREMSKLHEEIRRSTVHDLLGDLGEGDLKGEVTLVMEGSGVAAGPGAWEGAPPCSAPPGQETARRVAREWLRVGRSTRDTVEHLRSQFGLSRNQAYEVALSADRGVEP
ncbi:MAG: 16S rRNA (cytidine(1402)-2'-O)-methyltransferase [Gemmatimonadota bacterium]